MRSLTSKQVRTGIKNGFTVKDFCTKYGFKGERDFLAQLEKAFPNAGGDQALREIRKNEKNRQKTTKRPAATTKSKSTPRRGVDKVEKKKVVDPLTTLKSTEATLSSEVINLENQHKQLAGERRDCLSKLREKQQKVDEIYAELQKLQTAYEEVAKKNNGIVKQMNQISKVRAEKLAELTSVREQITKLETTIIAIYKDGKFEVVEGAAVSLEVNENDLSNLAHQLMEKDICEDLTIKQIKILSKLLLISQNSLRKVEFIFDSSALEKAYLASKPLST